MKNQSEKQQKKFLSGLMAVMLAAIFIIQALSVQVIGDDAIDKVLQDIYNDSCYMEWTESNDIGTSKSDYGENGRDKSSENTSSSITLRVYSVDGKIEAPPLLYSEAMLSYLNARDKPIVFVNNMRGDDKIDVLLREYSLLCDKGYLTNMRVNVIVLPGYELKKGIYAITPGSSEVEMAGVKTCRKILSLGGIATRTYKTLPFIAADLPYQNVFELAEEEYVAHIFLDKKYHICLNESVPVIKPSGRWSQIEDYFGCEINGSSIKIAILDTGIDKTHPDLDDLDDNSSTNDSKVIAEKCFTGEGHMWDGYGHGTHCASIAAGTGEASNYTYVGVAPQSYLINGKVLTDEGWGDESWIIDGIEWAVNNQSADILSMSFGTDINGDGTDPLSMAVDWATDQGAVCIVAAGNSGLQGMFTVGTPAVARKAITVGATTKNDEVVYISGWWSSSQGPTSDYRLKPDVCAPGLYIVAARANGTNMGSTVNDYYTKASGTSMATPHIAGAAALILQVHPNWNPIMVKSALMGNAKVLDDEHLWEQGAGRIDLCNSTNTTLLIIEPSSAFGILGLEDTATTTLTIMNLANTSKTVNISTFTISNWNETNYVSANVSLVTIAGGSNTIISMQVGPLDNNASQGWYEGWLNITNQTTVRAPYLFAAHFTTTQQLREGGSGGGGFSLFSNPFSLITGLIGIITELPLEIISASPMGQPNIIDAEEQSNIIDDIWQSDTIDEETCEETETADTSEILMDWNIIIKEDYRELLLSL